MRGWFGSLAVVRFYRGMVVQTTGKRPSPDGRGGGSDVQLFRHLQCIVDFDAEVANGAVELGMPQQ
jgi:hypothetical protein